MSNQTMTEKQFMEVSAIVREDFAIAREFWGESVDTYYFHNLLVKEMKRHGLVVEGGEGSNEPLTEKRFSEAFENTRLDFAALRQLGGESVDSCGFHNQLVKELKKQGHIAEESK